MAKQTLPGMKTGGGALPKMLTGLAFVAFVAFALKQPVEAAALVQNVATGFGHATDALMTFCQALN